MKKLIFLSIIFLLSCNSTKVLYSGKIKYDVISANILEMDNNTHPLSYNAIIKINKITYNATLDNNLKIISIDVQNNLNRQ